MTSTDKKKLPIRLQVKQILKSGEPRANDEWSNGKFDIEDTLRSIMCVIQYKMQQAYNAGAKSKNPSTVEFDKWVIEQEGKSRVPDKFVYPYL